MARNKFSLSHYRMFSSEMGKLIPIQCVPVIPGDTFQGSNSVLIRMAPLNTPVMHPVMIRVDTWFVPYRVTDPDWETFITGGGGSTPKASLGPGDDRLGKFFGINREQGLANAHPFQAYNLIYNQRYRDQDIITEVAEDNQDLLNCAWEKDYYTTARPWPAKGGNVNIPIKSNAGAGTEVRIGSVSPSTSATQQSLDSSGAALSMGGNTTGDTNLVVDPNDLRLAAALQRYGEARSRYGSRFTEYLRYLGVRNPSDARLQEPELLGSGRGMLNFSEVLQTAPNEGAPGEGVGDLYGHGIAGVRTRKWRRYFEEHGTVMTLLSLRPKSVYTTTTPREWLKEEPEDFYQRELTSIGEQPLWGSEIALGAGKFDTWAWVPRYEEYRFHPSSVSGEFLNVLNTWTMAREFATDPVLNQGFVECDPTKRIFQSQTNDTVLVMVNNNLVARRSLPKRPKPRVM